MKLLIILSVIACSYGDKLDRTYLPPESAGTAGGSPGSIAAPGTETELGVPKGTIFGSGPSSFGQPSGTSFGQPSGTSFGQPSSPLFGQPTGSAVGQPSSPSFGQPSGPSYGQTQSPSYGQPSGPSVGQPEGPTFGQASGPSISKFSESSFGQGQNQAGPQSGSTQPGQPGAVTTGSQYNQAGNSAGASTPGFSQAGSELNSAPGFSGQSQIPTSYNGPSQPDRARASIDKNAEILHYENNIDGDTFAYSFETSNGIAADEAGVATNGVRAQGGFSYTGDDGQFYSVRYTADENGYVPQGDHLPTPHPIPEEILKSLEENARAAAAGTQEGAYNPNEDSNLDNSASYPGIGSNAYQPGQGSVSQYSGPDTSSVTGRPQDGQEFDSKYNTPATSFGPQGILGIGAPQYDGPTSSLTNYARPGSSVNQLSGSPYGTSGTSPTTSRPGSQDGNSPASQYTGSFGPGLSSQVVNGIPGAINTGERGSTKPGAQPFSQDRQTRPTQYGTPISSSSPNFPAEGSQSSLMNNVPSFDSSSGTQSGFPKQFNKSPTSQTGALTSSSYGSKRPFESPDFPSQNGAQSPTSQSGAFPTSGSGSLGQSSGYQYSSPSAFSAGTRPGAQKNPSPVSASSAPQFGTSAGTPFGSNGQIKPQDISSETISGSESSRPYGSQSATSQYNGPISSFLRPKPEVDTSPTTQYQTPAGSPFGATGLTGSQSPTSQYTTPGTSPFGFKKPGSQTVPSYASSSPASEYDTSAGSSVGLGASRPVSGQSSTSQYNAPSLSTFGSVNTNSQDFSNRQSGVSQRPQFELSGSSGFLKPTISGAEGQISQKQDDSGYKYSRPQTQFDQQRGKLSGSRFRPSDTAVSSKPVNKETVIGSGLSRDIYNPSGSTPKGTSNASGFPKFQASSSQDYPAGQSLTNSQDSPFSGTGQYSSTGLGSKPTGSTFSIRDNAVGNTPTYQSGQITTSKSPMLGSAPYQYNRPESQGPGQIGYKPTFGSSGDKRPGQIGSPSTFGLSGQERPGQVAYQSNFGSSEQKIPGQVGSQPNFGSPTQDRPGQAGYRPTFGSSGQEKPGQVGYQPTFGSSGQKLPGQLGSQLSNGPSKDERPGPRQEGSHSGYEYSKQNKPGQTGSQSSFSPSFQDVPNQTGTQPTFGFSGQDRPTQSTNQPSFGSTGQQQPDQKGFPSGSGTLGPKRPGQAGYQSPFTSSRQDRPGQFGKGKPTEDFNGPRQPPSFTPEEGYKY
ncbi:unnamed protein product [Arctia plantaginis]|uniref:Uncharacterized protein n=1 Tax=Arctia plantaginis TaxID=874455 RepID=A0A8S1BA77_ARCPL|nr:unnamed protein product [Arctia plantaginis]